MDRRKYLLLASTFLPLAACIGDESTQQDEFNESLYRTLDGGHQLEIINTRWEGEVVIVEHREGESTAADIGDVAGGLASLYDSYDVEIDYIEGHVLNDDGDVIATYQVDQDLAASFAREELDEEEYVDAVLDTYRESSA